MERLRRTAEIDRVFREGSRRNSAELTIVFRRAEGLESRVALAVPRSVGNAVTRNRCRRVIREAMRALAPELAGSVDVVIVVRPAAVGIDGRQAREILARLLRKAGLFRP